MSSQREQAAPSPASLMSRIDWRAGAASGFIATIIMGAAITAVDLATLRVAIAGLYGFEGSFAAGWVAHLIHGTLFGVLFAFVLADPILRRVNEWLWKSVAAGLVYSVVLAVAGAGVIMPVWLTIVGYNEPPTVPYITTPILTWHLLYGLVLGALYHYLD